MQADSCIQMALHIAVAKANPVIEYTYPLLVTQADREPKLDDWVLCVHETASRRASSDVVCHTNLNKPASNQNQHTQQQRCKWLLCKAHKAWSTLQMSQRNNNDSISYFVFCAPVCTSYSSFIPQQETGFLASLACQ